MDAILENLGDRDYTPHLATRPLAQSQTQNPTRGQSYAFCVPARDH